MALSDVNFNVSKSNDKSILSAMLKAIKASKFRVSGVTATTTIGGDAFNFNADNLDQNEEFNTILNQGSELIGNFSFSTHNQDRKASCTFSLSRSTDHDVVRVKGNGFQNVHRPDYTVLLASLRKNLGALDSEKLTKALPKKIEDHYKIRENELSKLEDISKSLIFDQEKYRKQLEQRFDDRESKLETLYKEKEEVLSKREKELEDQRSKVDDRASKHARRALRDSLKEIFDKRGQEFKLSTGTVNLRDPVGKVSLIVISVLALLFIISFLVSFKIIGSIDQTDWVIHLKQLALAASLGAMTIFYIKWQNRWFEKHSTEEFLLKRQEIDIDRASWAVELAIEWREEHQSDIPDDLLQILTKNLFEYNEKVEPKLHPADELASAILGSSAKARLNLPNGSELEIGKEGIKKLSKEI